MMKDVNFKDLQQDCEICGSPCPIWGRDSDLLDGALDVAVVGNECLDWSSVGAQLELCGFGLITLLAWAFETLARELRCPG